jgi:MarR family transcriptional regulator, organic hydroperoxide resistance regulator
MPKRREEALEPALVFLRELWALDHALASTSKRMHHRMGITAEQRMVLRFIGKSPGTTAADLAALLRIEKSTLSFTLKRLEQRGLVTRSRDAFDARKSRIALTMNGRAFDRRTVGTVERAVARVLGVTKPRELEVVRSFLQKLVRSLEDQ